MSVVLSILGVVGGVLLVLLQCIGILLLVVLEVEKWVFRRLGRGRSG